MAVTVPVEELYAKSRLTSAQLAIWLGLKLYPDVPVLDAAALYFLPPGARIDCFQSAFQRLIDTSDAFRTIIVEEDGIPQPRVIEPFSYTMDIVDVSGHADPIEAAKGWAREQSLHVFDCAQPMFRAILLKLRPDFHAWYFHVNHLITDAYSSVLTVQRLNNLYRLAIDGKLDGQIAFPQYADYAAEEFESRQSKPPVEELTFWRTKLARRLEPPAFYGRTRTSSNTALTTRGKLLGDGIAQKLLGMLDDPRVAGKTPEATLFNLFAAALYGLMYRISGSRELAIGTMYHNRRNDAARDTIGVFVGALPLRVRIDEGETFLSLARKVRAEAVENRKNVNGVFRMSLDYGDYDVMLNVHVAQPVGLLGYEENLPHWVRSGHGRETLVIHAFYVPQLMDYFVIFDLNDSVFDEYFRECVSRHFSAMLRALVDDLEREIDDVDLLTDDERHRVLVEFNDTARPYPDMTTANALIEAQARNRPDAIAVVCGEHVLTYAQLDARANQLARYLQSLCVKHEDLVGICTTRSVEMVIAALGVMKAGGAYVPIDPAQPAERLAFMLNDSGVRVLLTLAPLAGRFAERSARCVLLDTDRERISREDSGPVESASGPAALAYAIYTSGSTGWPKGTLIEHRGLCNLMQMQAATFEITPASRVLQFASFGFDASVSEIFVTLGAGATLCIPPEDVVFDPWALAAFIQEHAVTIATLPPALLRLMDSSGATTLRTVVSAGERCPREVVERWAPGRRFVNGYGPTEATVCAAMAVCDAGAGNAPPIGRAPDNTQLYVLDRKMRPVPLGTPGELHIGGVGLARGYLGRAELTADRFVANPFVDTPGARLYKTGDCVRCRPDGQIEFIGRIDSQVKLHGYRIELSEIESVLESHARVRSAAVVVRGEEGNEPYLVAYIVADGGGRPTVSELRSHAGRRVPRYMVPSIYTFVDELPLTASGKVDRAALPSPSPQRDDPAGEIDVPQSDIERRLAAIFATVLRTDTVGLHDHFFERGGDSIASIQLAGLAREAGLAVSPNHLFEYPTVASLAAALSRGVLVHAEQSRVTGRVPLAPIQKWFFEIPNPNPSHWNQSVTLRANALIDIDVLSQAIEAVVDHHDMLRARFRRASGTWEQVIAERGGAPPVQLVDLSQVDDKQLAESRASAEADIQGSLDIERGPVLRFAVLRFGRGRPDAVIAAVHHLVIDAVSWRIVLEDLERAYDQIMRGVPNTFLPKTTSFKHWSTRLSALAAHDRTGVGARYWRAHCDDPAPAIPTELAAGPNSSGSSSTLHVALDADRATKLFDRFNHADGAHLLDALAAGLAGAFVEWTGGDAFAFNLETHGREHSFDDVDLSRTVGWFTSLIPVRLHIDANADTPSRVAHVAAQLHEARKHALDFGVRRFLADDNPARSDLPRFADVSFNYMGDIDRLSPAGRLFTTDSLSQNFRGNYHPESERACLIEINGFAHDRTLHFYWTYSANRHRPDTIARLANTFIQQLETIADAHVGAPAPPKSIAETFNFAEMGTLIPIKPTGSRPPFFCVPGGGGVVFPFYNLVPYLDADQPLYGLQDPSLDENVAPFERVEDLAAFYLDRMRSVQPHGPYYVAGWSFGGAVAYEIAQQAVHAGEDVALVAIMDQLAPPLLETRGTLRQRLGKIVPAIAVLGRTVKGSFPYVRDGLYLVFSRDRQNGNGGAGRISLVDYFTWAWRDALFKSFLQQADIARVAVADSSYVKFKQPATMRVMYVLRSHVRALKFYRARPFPGVVDVFRSIDDWKDLKLDDDEDLGWGALAEGGIRVHRISGSHVTLMRKPHIFEFAHNLNERLRETQPAKRYDGVSSAIR
ncbi:MAG: amino acid adenylation domain-containing protein [Candidatus Hydrogenedentes bacterium]|nr:amino acid adenylation domain-containing protein [Candidatus Hydrogenedentota bacterium]